jgi:outer membrane protein TolC
MFRGGEEIMKRLSLWLILYTALTGWLLGKTQEAREALTLDQCVAIALNQNPLLQSSQHLYQASLARVQGIGSAQPGF